MGPPVKTPFALAVAATALFAGAARGQDDPALARLARARVYREVAVSPGGKSVAWTEWSPEIGLALFVADTAPPGPARPVIGKAGFVRAPRWSPDGTSLAFLADGDRPGQAQLYVAPVGLGPVRRLTQIKGALADPRWSPDGTQIAFLLTEDAPRGLGPLQPGAVETGEVGEKLYHQRLAVLDLASGRLRVVSPADLYVYEYGWSPDGRRCALIAAPAPGDNNWYIARLHLLTLASGACEVLVKPGMQIAVPRWSPDGRSIAYVGGLMSDEGVVGGEVYTVPVAGGPPVNRTPRLAASVSGIAWLPSSRQLLLTSIIDGGSGIARLDLDGGGVKQLWQGGETISAGTMPASVSRDGRTVALIRHSFARPPEVWTGPPGDWRPVTQANRDVRPEWGKAQSLRWKSDPFEVQGWLLYPRDFDPARQYPLVVHVHGGPAGAARPQWLGADSIPGALSRRGYFVFFPNPRGSFGQGERFTRANVKDLGHGDWRDIQAGVDAVLAAAPVDPQRVGIMGWSYGGYLTMWAVTQTDRYRAAVAGAGIANWQSYYGQNGIDQWLIPYFGASVYDDPDVYARSSPINFIKRVRTPTLLLVGERDVECPLPQSQEFFRALKTLGVTTKLVVYAGEGHAIARPEHRLDVLRRTLAWFDDRLGPRR